MTGDLWVTHIDFDRLFRTVIHFTFLSEVRVGHFLLLPRLAPLRVQPGPCPFVHLRISSSPSHIRQAGASKSSHPSLSDPTSLKCKIPRPSILSLQSPAPSIYSKMLLISLNGLMRFDMLPSGLGAQPYFEAIFLKLPSATLLYLVFYLACCISQY